MVRCLLACSLVVSGFVTGCVGVAREEAVAAAGEEQQALALRDGARVMNFIAHEDDDILAMTPDLQDIIRAGATVQTVEFTAGENSRCQAYVEERELGQRLGYEVMAGVDYQGHWQEEKLTVEGHEIRKVTMPGGKVSILYIGFKNNDGLDLQRLWQDTTRSLEIETLADTRRSKLDRYNREGMIKTVLALLQAFGPSHVNTLDSSEIWRPEFPYEHPDHVASALFAMSALQRYAQTPSLRMYRTYNEGTEDENLSEVDHQSKLAIYAAYAPHDPFLCEGALETLCDAPIICNNPLGLVYEQFNARQYVIRVDRQLSGPMVGPGKKCLLAGGSAVGSEVSLGACSEPQPRWSLPVDGTLRHVDSGLCVSAQAGEPRRAGLTLQRCDATQARQRFYLTGVGQLRGADATCARSADGLHLTLEECADDQAMRGFALQFQAPFVAVGSAALGSGTTFDFGDLDGDQVEDLCVRRSNGVDCARTENGKPGAFRHVLDGFRDRDGFGSDATGGTFQLADVSGDGKADACARGSDGIFCADWDPARMQFGAVSERTQGADFSDLVGYGTSAAIYRSLHFVDVNGDRKLDACARNSSGIECALNRGGGRFGAVAQRTTAEFTDALGWLLETAGATVQFGDVNGDGVADVCGRGSAGIRCMLGTSTGFSQPHLWSHTKDFSDAQGWNAYPGRFGSIQIGDINGDGMADVCGRGAQGLACAVSTGRAFAPAQPMLPLNTFSDPGSGQSRYGDLAITRLAGGAAHAAVCVRGGADGLRCASAP